MVEDGGEESEDGGEDCEDGGGESHLRSSGCSSESQPQSVGRGGSGGVGGGWKLEEVGGGWKSL